MPEISYDQLTDLQIRVLAIAEDAMNDAYDPYSWFSVGAALACPDGRIFRGVNIGNASSSATICAERAAIANAYSNSRRIFQCMDIIARHRDFNTTDVTNPCGVCRQVMVEMEQVSGNQVDIILATTKLDKIVITNLAEILKFPFGPRDLGIDVSKFRRERKLDSD